jgi:hypothetical protein
MLHDPAAGRHLPAQIEVRDRVQAGEQRVDQRDGAQKKSFNIAAS